MPRLFYGSIQSQGVRIHYYRTGGEKPPVVLLHALGESGLAWNRLPMALEPEFDVVLVDARGHGFSGSPASGFGPQEHAGDVLELIAALQLHRPAILGHDTGAVTAVTAAGLAPERIRALVLEDPPWPGPLTPEEADRRAAEWSAYLQAGKGRSFDDLEQLFASEHPDWHASEAFQWVKARQLANPQAAEFLLHQQPDWAEMVSRLKVPGLIVSGEPEYGALLDEPTARKIQQLWKVSQVERIPGAGHHAHRERYREFMHLVRRYLRRIMISG